MILAGVLMLRHLKMFKEADLIENSILYTYGEGAVRTRDVMSDANQISTSAFTETVIAHLGKAPKGQQGRVRQPLKMPAKIEAIATVQPKARQVVGVDVFLESADVPQLVGDTLTSLAKDTPLKLKMISNRGTKVYPATGAMTDLIDHHRCRFISATGDEVTDEGIALLLKNIATKYRWCQTEKLQEFDGKPSFTKAQGED